MFKCYCKDEINFNDIHLFKENNYIFRFLKMIIDFKGEMKYCIQLELSQINELKLFQNSLLDKFITSDNFLETILTFTDFTYII